MISLFSAEHCSDYLQRQFDAFRSSARKASNGGVEKNDAESVKKRWLTAESFTSR
jgi:hypothetical protein